MITISYVCIYIIASLDFQDIQSLKAPHAVAYARSKLAQVYFTYELHRRMQQQPKQAISQSDNKLNDLDNRFNSKYVYYISIFYLLVRSSLIFQVQILAFFMFKQISAVCIYISRYLYLSLYVVLLQQRAFAFIQGILLQI